SRSGVCPDDQASCTLDDANNVERIVVGSNDITAGTWTATVSAENGLVEGGPQAFALIISFPFSLSSDAPTPSAPTAPHPPVMLPPIPGE
ncbi:unnamed protein product, partial [Sphacelaria rigidula]